MSKSLGNYIGIAEPANEMFGKIMSISDDLMWRYFELLSFKPMTEINSWQQACNDGENPRNYKVLLAQEIIERFHDKQAADHALTEFEARFKHGAMPDDIQQVELNTPEAGYAIANLLKDAGLTKSTSDSLRMLKQGAVRIDAERVTDSKHMLKAGSQHIYQVGKRRFAEIKLI
jgi:tyrosyl-tRNA synthetase